jgi:hypothetical protein
VKIFKYLGTTITADGNSNTKVRNRVAQAKTAFHKMKNILCNRALALETREQVLQTYIKPIFLYSSKAWTINSQIEKHIVSTEMWFLRRMMRIPWTARKTNAKILIETNEQKKYYCRLKAKFIAYILRKGKLEDIVTVSEKQDRGRQWKNLLDSLTKWMGVKTATELILPTVDRSDCLSAGHSKMMSYYQDVLYADYGIVFID